MKRGIFGIMAMAALAGCSNAPIHKTASAQIVTQHQESRKLSSVQQITLGSNATLNPGDVAIVSANNVNSAITCGGAAPAKASKTFSRSTIRYYQGWIDVPMSQTNCTQQDRESAKNEAAQLAMTDCQTADLLNCQVIGDTITEDGVLESSTMSQYIDAGPAMLAGAKYVGCVAVATAKGIPQ